MKRPLSNIVTLISVLALAACGENGAGPDFGAREAAALAEPYAGVKTSDGLKEGLFPISATGVATAPVANAANEFLGVLDDAETKKISFAIDDNEWRKWSNVDNGIYDRQGISLKDMNAAQKKAAFALMSASLSAKGLKQSRDIMKTDKTLSELNDNAANLDEELYFFTIMGTPSETEPWGWQLDGHHLVINYFVLGDQVVMSPVFMGGEPAITETGVHKGNVILQPEQDKGLEFVQSLSADQLATAVISTDKSHNDNQASANKDNLTLDYAGLQASAMTDEQKASLIELIQIYVGNIRDEHATVKMKAVVKHLDETHFAWIGDTSDDAVFYYRIHSPVVLIEFDHQGPIALPDAGPRDQAIRNHIHTVVRTPNGNDYGKDLLRQHLEKDH